MRCYLSLALQLVFSCPLRWFHGLYTFKRCLTLINPIESIFCCSALESTFYHSRIKSNQIKSSQSPSIESINPSIHQIVKHNKLHDNIIQCQIKFDSPTFAARRKSLASMRPPEELMTRTTTTMKKALLMIVPSRPMEDLDPAPNAIAGHGWLVGVAKQLRPAFLTRW
jgi:hypothetical protein